MNLEQAIEGYLNGVYVGLSLITYRNYRLYLNRFLHEIGNESWEVIGLSEVIKFQRFLMSRSLKPSTIHYYSIVIRELFRFWDRDNVAKKIRLPKYKSIPWQPAGKVHLETLLKVLSRDSKFLELRDELILRFIFASGVRVSEATDLDIRSIQTNIKQAVIITKKTLKERVIYWDDLTNELFTLYLELREKTATCNYVFVSVRGNKMTSRDIQRLFKELREKAQMTERTVPHSARHGFIDYGADKVPMPILQRLAGHETITSTQGYIHTKDKEVERYYQETYAKRFN